MAKLHSTGRKPAKPEYSAEKNLTNQMDAAVTLYKKDMTLQAIAEDLSLRLFSEFSVNARFHDKTVHILRSSEPEAEAEPPPLAARSVLDRLA